MSSGSDQFFEEEDELLAEQAQRPQAKTQQRPSGATPSGRPAPRGSAQQGTPRRGRKPPSFAMAVAIAVVALILGFALGYFVALNTMGERIANDYGEMLEYASSGSSTTSQSSAGTTDASDEGSLNEQTGLPEGHPDLSQFINEDGTYNEEAIEAYREQMAAAQASSSSDAQ